MFLVLMSLRVLIRHGESLLGDSIKTIHIKSKRASQGHTQSLQARSCSGRGGIIMAACCKSIQRALCQPQRPSAAKFEASVSPLSEMPNVQVKAET